jgi:hypothetical protein
MPVSAKWRGSFLTDVHGHAGRVERLLLAICDQVRDSETGIVFRGAVAQTIGLAPDYNFDDEREFVEIALILENAGYITNRSTSYEVFGITQKGIRACEELMA